MGQALIPDAVAQRVLVDRMPPAKAWRTYLHLTQTQVANRMGIAEAAYAALEEKSDLSKRDCDEIAAPLGISHVHLDL